MEKNKLKNQRKKITRRKFFKDVTLGAIGGAFIPALLSCGNAQSNADTEQSRVVRVHHPGATDGSGGKDNEHLVDSVIKEMVDEGVKTFTGKSSVNGAWADIIPDPSKKVAIKVNCQITAIYTKSKVVTAITDGLIMRGTPADNIVIYDRTDNAFQYGGFIKNTDSGIKVGTVGELGGWSSTSGLYNMAKLICGESGDFDCDYIINVPCLKALDGYSGVTLSMKNHYGTCYPEHSDIMNRIPLYNSLSQIKYKARLIILDGIFCNYQWDGSRDQSFVDITNKLLFATDPVALDYVGWQMIESLRSVHGLQPVDPAPNFIQIASADFGLGTNDPDQMEIIDLEL